MRYMILRADTKEFGIRHPTTEDAFKELEEKVNEAIEEGWKPQGGVSVTEEDHSCNPGPSNRIMIIAQAMVKED